MDTHMHTHMHKASTLIHAPGHYLLTLLSSAHYALSTTHSPFCPPHGTHLPIYVPTPSVPLSPGCLRCAAGCLHHRPLLPASKPASAMQCSASTPLWPALRLRSSSASHLALLTTGSWRTSSKRCRCAALNCTWENRARSKRRPAAMCCQLLHQCGEGFHFQWYMNAYVLT